MARKRRTSPADRNGSPASATVESRDKKKSKHRDGTRETIESIVVAFILAFLFRTFEAEAFVIPTGSMAPTLYGRHKDVECPACGMHYAVGASDELRSHGDLESQYLNPALRVLTAYCPNCRYGSEVKDDPVFTGDRILVNKWPYEFGEPDRWDVVVFKWPGGPRTNYIKRLVGLPGEELRIERGDVSVREQDGDRWNILRKDDPTKQRELQLLVYDDDHPPVPLLEAGWPERWEPMEADGWLADREARTYAVDTPTGNTAWLRYGHFVPDRQVWASLPDPPEEPRPQLVTDFLAYNAYTGGVDDDPLGPTERDAYWVGDLTISGEVEVARADGELLLELVEGFRRYRCAIDLATGTAELYYLEDGLDRDAPIRTDVATGPTPLGEEGRFTFSFANVDRRLLLWVRNSVVEFDQPTTYAPASLPGPTERDLAPVGVAATGTAVDVRHLLLERDVYYRAEQKFGLNETALADDLSRLRQDPTDWARLYDLHARPVRFEPLGPGEFFMLGDNSARSQDSRLWDNLNPHGNRHAVPESALVGKAFFVYWPHGVPFLNDGKGYAPDLPILRRFFYHHTGPGEISDYPSFTVPFYPQYHRMTRIR